MSYDLVKILKINVAKVWGCKKLKKFQRKQLQQFYLTPNYHTNNLNYHISSSGPLR